MNDPTSLLGDQISRFDRESDQGSSSRPPYWWRVCLGGAVAATALALSVQSAGADFGDRGYELVSPADSGAYVIGPNEATGAWSRSTMSTPKGDTIVFATQGTLPELRMIPDGDTQDPIVARRDHAGWTHFAPVADRTPNFDTNPYLLDLAGNGGVAILSMGLFGGTPGQKLDPRDQQDGPGFYGVDLASDFARYLNAPAGGAVRTDAYRDRYMGRTSDDEVIYLSSEMALTPDVPDTGNTQLYRVTADGPELVSAAADGTPATLIPGVGFDPTPITADRPNSVSADGSTVTFTAMGLHPGSQDVYDVYQRTARGTAPVTWLSQPSIDSGGEPANRYFEGASDDGTRVYFSTTQAMTVDDENDENDIYVFDTGSGDLELATPAGLGPDPDGTADFATVSDDGNVVFFVTARRLVEDDDDSGSSVYARDFEADRVYYVADASVAFEDNSTFGGGLVTNGGYPFSQRPIWVSGDGQVAVLELATPQTEDDTNWSADLYVWTATGGLVSIPRDGAGRKPTAGCKGRIVGTGRMACRLLTDDGRKLFIGTGRSLSPDDTDGGFLDIYAYDTEVGSFTLISPPGDAPSNVDFVDASESGRDVFFITPETLDASRDRDGGQADLYVARQGPVLAALDSSVDCDADACQGSPAVRPVPPVVGTVTFAGRGDERPSARRKPVIGVRTIRPGGAQGAVLKVRVPAAGRISVKGKAVRKVGRRVGKAGSVSVRLSLTDAARRSLVKRKSFAAMVRVTYRRADGEATSKRIRIVFAAPKASRPARDAKRSLGADGGRS